MNKLNKILLSTLLIILFSGCNQNGVKPEKITIDQTLPKVTSIKSMSDINSIAFEWKPNHDPRVKGYYIYRNNPNSKKTSELIRVHTINDRFISHYLDLDLLPNKHYLYRFSSFNKNGRESPLSKTIKTKTKKMLNSVSYIKTVNNLPRRIKLIFRPHSDNRVKEYIIERMQVGKNWIIIGKVQGRLQAEFMDKDLEDNKIYKYRIRVATFNGLVSYPSEIVTARTKALPTVITGLSATRNLPKRIKLKWHKSDEKNVKSYIIYRSNKFDTGFKKYKSTTKTTFIDKINKDGIKKFYKVKTINADGLEGILQNVAVVGITLEKPKTPLIVSANIINGKVIINWRKQDKRAVKFMVLKNIKTNIIESKTIRFVDIKETVFYDKDIKQGVSYRYSVISIDKNGIKSKPSDRFELALNKNN